MLFRKNVEPCCAYCVHGSYIDDESVICVKKGVMKSWGKCRRFEYDPLKRQPEAPSKPMTKGFKEEDLKYDINQPAADAAGWFAFCGWDINLKFVSC